ncbi:transmembrane protein 19-like [Paramacrobiotus metropolitanus]|uniref:transmembrane protein 19-like n=1 Tax=Paramacrobiotus metropolitanus TaxID=2943436 RepID=UPI0024462565|nr:transmembrane protein 19-like [Paramacrobiotus metropolitanus]
MAITNDSRRLRQHPRTSSPNGRICSPGIRTLTKECQERYKNRSYADLVLLDAVDSFSALFIVLFGLIILFPFALGFWMLFHWFSAEGEYISPVRWLMAVMLPLYISVWGFKRQSLNLSGAFAAYVTGFIVTMSSYAFMVCLVGFFLLGSKSTNVRADLKRRFEADYRKGGQRNWVQVFCNGGVATLFAFLYMLETGCREKAIDFSISYYETTYALAVLGALACSCGDTLASELGSVWSRREPRLITTFRKVPRGTNGAVSVTGLLLSILGGVIIAGLFYVTTLLCLHSNIMNSSPPQWPLIPLGGILGFLGSLFDSYLGAIFQYSGLDEMGRVVNFSGPKIVKISGFSILDNHSVNFISVLLTALLAPRIGLTLWSYLY